VAHSSNAGSSEISSCNYPARAKGIKNGMFMSAARDLCPELVILPYDFKLYEELCGIIYSILYTSSALMVEPVSVDEAYLEYPCNTDGMKIASDIRERIQKMTGGCTASETKWAVFIVFSSSM
jgi:DNA repair protein REV1